MHSFVDCYRLL